MKPLNLILAPVIVLLILLALATVVPASAQAGCKNSGDPVRSITKKNARSAINCLFNKERTGQNVKRNGDLEQAAQSHSSVMAARNCYAHQCPGEGNLQQRVARTGYYSGSSNWGLGEVIIVANVRASSRQIVNAWMNSSGHASNIKNSGWDHVGIGLARRGAAVFVTGDFGRR